MIMYLLAGLLGIIFQLLVKMKSIKDLFETSNQVFVTAKFFEKEIISIASSVVFIIILAMVLPEILNFKPELENYIRIIFTMGGAIGSYCFGYFLGKSKKYIKDVIDKKTNIADGKTKADE